MFEDLINLHKDYFIYEHGIIQIQRKKVDMIPLSMSDQEIREIKQFIQQSDWFTFEERSMLQYQEESFQGAYLEFKLNDLIWSEFKKTLWEYRKGCQEYEIESPV